MDDWDLRNNIVKTKRFSHRKSNNKTSSRLCVYGHHFNYSKTFQIQDLINLKFLLIQFSSSVSVVERTVDNK